jgi:acyl-CoA synthetase (AMP-forming)/AMP-acid ligase II
VYPAELENVLADCPAIAEAAVVGVPDPKWGEAVVAAVVRKPGAALDEAAVLALFERRLARFKHPRRVVFVESLPKTALGKVQKAELRRLVGAGQGS